MGCTYIPDVCYHIVTWKVLEPVAKFQPKNLQSLCAINQGLITPTSIYFECRAALPKGDGHIEKLRSLDTMTTIPDAGLECDLLKKMIKEFQGDDMVLKQQIGDWITKRLFFPDPGFGHLGPELEKLCNEAHLLSDILVATKTEMDLALKQLPPKIQDAERTYTRMLDRLNADGRLPDTVREIRKNTLNTWRDEKIEDLRGQAAKSRDKWDSLSADLDELLGRIISYARTGSVPPETDLAENAMMVEVEELMGQVSIAGDKEKQGELDDELLRAPTLTLGAATQEDSDVVMEQAPPKGSQAIDLEPPPKEVLPENQLGDLSVNPETPTTSAAPTPSPAPVEKPVGTQQSPIDLGDSSSQPTNSPLRTPSCEEQAVAHIQQLQEGPIKSALLSLAEASLVKVGVANWGLSPAPNLHHALAFCQLGVQAPTADDGLGPAAARVVERKDTPQLEVICGFPCQLHIDVLIHL